MAKIEMHDVNLTFRVRKTPKVTLKEYVLKRMFSKRKNPILDIPALRDITLELHDGDRLGIIGHNGAGKSTLLKVIAGIYPPSSGQLDVQGNISSLFDISLGFELDANGWDNIRYRAFLQGETPQSIAKKIDKVAEYSELGEFLNMPVRYYSAGMLIRLAFSIASAIEPEILLIDEVLAAGDLSFAMKAKERMKELMTHARLMVLISHAIDGMADFCSKVAWMDHGRIVMLGQAEEVVAAYKASVEAAPPMPGAETAKAA